MQEYLEGKKIRLRAIEPEDAEYMYLVENDSESWRYSDSIAPCSMHQLKEYAENYDSDPIRSGQLRLIAVEKETERKVGIVDLYEISGSDRRAKIGIYVGAEHRKKGVGGEMVELMVKYAFGMLWLHQIIAFIETGNEGSEQLFLKNGFVKTAVLMEWKRNSGGGYTDVEVYQKIRTESR